MIDTIVFCFILIAAAFGYLRGIVSQVMALVGLILAFLLAPMCGKALGGVFQSELGSSLYIAQKLAVLAVGVGIYILARFVGFWVDRNLSKKMKGFKKLNKYGGAVLGAAKGAIIIIVIFAFIALIPKSFMKSWLPKVLSSQSYRLATRFNPMVNQRFLERLRNFRSIIQNGPKKVKFENDPDLERILKRHNMLNTMKDKDFIQHLEEGDFEALQKTENVEKLMNDDDMEKLLEKLSKEEGKAHS